MCRPSPLLPLLLWSSSPDSHSFLQLDKELPRARMRMNVPPRTNALTGQRKTKQRCKRTARERVCPPPDPENWWFLPYIFLPPTFDPLIK